MRIQEIVDTIERILRVGAGESMREDERAAGNEVLRPGETPWLPVEDWPDDVVVSVRGKEVRIVAIMARQPKTGAFSRLITTLIGSGMTPVVVEPMMDMPAIMRKWGWKMRVVGSGFDSAEEWRPTKTWSKARRAGQCERVKLRHGGLNVARAGFRGGRRGACQEAKNG